jgi:hypothetical protein
MVGQAVGLPTGSVEPTTRGRITEAALLFGGMKIAGAGPAGNRVYGLVAMIGLYPRQFGRDQIERLVPRHLDKGFYPASRPVAVVAVIKKALADHGLGDPASMMDDIGHVVDHR